MVQQIKENYCTEEYLLEIEKLDLDYDIILNAQDCDINSLITLTVKADEKNLFIVKYQFFADSVEIKVFVKLIEDKYKIVKIL